MSASKPASSPQTSELDLKTSSSSPRATDTDVFDSLTSSTREGQTFLRVKGEEGYVPIDKYEGQFDGIQTSNGIQKMRRKLFAR
jgi:hypothetical protein